MRARMTTGLVQPGKMDELVDRLQASVYPFYQEQQGFKGALLLTDPSLPKTISITLWNTQDDLTAGETASQELRAGLLELLKERMTEYFEVSIQA